MRPQLATVQVPRLANVVCGLATLRVLASALILAHVANDQPTALQIEATVRLWRPASATNEVHASFGTHVCTTCMPLLCEPVCGRCVSAAQTGFTRFKQYKTRTRFSITPMHENGCRTAPAKPVPTPYESKKANVMQLTSSKVAKPARKPCARIVIQQFTPKQHAPSARSR